MATKMCFAVSCNAETAYEEIIIEFEYVKGIAFSQKKKNVLSFHKSIKERFPNSRIIEISTKSLTPLGVKLSAFNLKLDGYPVECVFQSSKVFDGNIQYEDLLYESPKIAKSFIHDEVKLPVIGFKYKNEFYETFPYSMFYDYIYISAIIQSGMDISELLNYDIFTDIEFNEKKSYNCQARACAIYSYMLRTGKVEYYMSSKERFKELYNNKVTEQLKLFY